jgi:hypothetical protein
MMLLSFFLSEQPATLRLSGISDGRMREFVAINFSRELRDVARGAGAHAKVPIFITTL